MDARFALRPDATTAATSLAIVIGALIVVTPLCGAVFGCGCDWPWSGLASRCNAFIASSMEHCPWCVHPLLGFGLPAVATLAGLIVGVRSAGRGPRSGSRTRRWLRAVALGSLVTVCLMALSGLLTPVLTGYLPTPR